MISLSGEMGRMKRMLRSILQYPALHHKPNIKRNKGHPRKI
jgi:hypothetical protein